MQFPFLVYYSWHGTINAWDQFGRREVACDGKSTYVHHAVGVRNRAIITTKFLGQKYSQTDRK